MHKFTFLVLITGLYIKNITSEVKFSLVLTFGIHLISLLSWVKMNSHIGKFNKCSFSLEGAWICEIGVVKCHSFASSCRDITIGHLEV